MGGFILIILADIFLAFCFAGQKYFESKNGSSPAAGSAFSCYCNFFKTVFFGAVCTVTSLFFKEPKNSSLFSPFSWLFALIIALLVSAYTVLGFSLLKKGGITLYTLFLMLGGMTLPYLYGVIFLNERLTVLRTVGIILIIAALIFYNINFKKENKNNKENNQTKKSNLIYILPVCIAVFILNGFVSIASKIHQIESSLPKADTFEFSFLSSALGFVFSCFLYLFFKKAEKTSNKENKSIKNKQNAEQSPKGITDYIKNKNVLFATIAAAFFGGISYLLQLKGAVNIPASVLYPLVTGGSIVFSAAADKLLFKMHLSVTQIIGLITCIAGTFFFL